MPFTQKTFDIIVIGAGPAGLAFCASKASANRKILLVEAGKRFSERDSSRPEDVGSGVTGAGAYIDGKLSFFPAGTALWRSSYGLLSDAFAECREALLPYSEAEIPPMPAESEILEYLFDPEATWKLKPYKSIYMSNENRAWYLRELIESAQQNCHVETRTRVVSIQPHNGSFLVGLDNGDCLVKMVECRKVVLAGGRFMPLQQLLSSFPTAEKEVFRRHEFGIRIQVPHTNEGVKEMASFGCLDPKFVIRPSPDVEFRTFCFCHRGMVCQSEIDGLCTYSGRADVAETELTNFGLMARTKNSLAFSPEDVAEFLRTPFHISLSQVAGRQARLAEIRAQLVAQSRSIGSFIANAIEQLFERFPALCCKQLELFGPCLEGVGTYPNTDHLLQVKGIDNMYAIGDTSGTFRGLIPSLLSGYYLAHELDQFERAPLLLTSNSDKILEIGTVLGLLPSRSLDDNHLLHIDAIQHAVAKARFAKMELTLSKSLPQRDLLVEVSSLEIDVLDGYPGVHVRTFFERLGVERIDTLARGSGATFVCVLALISSQRDTVLTFEGRCRGELVPPSGNNGFGWDSIFQPEGYKVTFGAMDRIVKSKLSARYLAAVKLRRYLASLTNEEKQIQFV